MPLLVLVESPQPVLVPVPVPVPVLVSRLTPAWMMVPAMGLTAGVLARRR